MKKKNLKPKFSDSEAAFSWLWHNWHAVQKSSVVIFVLRKLQCM